MAASRGLSNVWEMIYSEILRPGKMYHQELVYAYIQCVYNQRMIYVFFHRTNLFRLFLCNSLEMRKNYALDKADALYEVTKAQCLSRGLPWNVLLGVGGCGAWQGDT